MNEATPNTGTSLLSTADAVEALLSQEAPEEDTVDGREEPTEQEEVLSDPQPDPDEVEVEAEAEESDSEEVEEVDESEEEEEVDEAPVVEEPQRYRVKSGDDEVEVTLDELRNSYMRNADYTRKTQHVAEERKAVEAELEHLHGERQRYHEQLVTLETALNQAEPDQAYWDELQSADQMEFLRQRENARDRKDALAQIQAERQKVQSEEEAELQARRDAHMAKERARVPELIPEWSDPEVQAKEAPAVVTYAQRTGGYTEEEISNIGDARALVMIRKAYLYDELMKKKPAATKKAQKAPKLIKSGQPTSKKQNSASRRAKALANISKNKGRSSIDAAVDYMLTK